MSTELGVDELEALVARQRVDKLENKRLHNMMILIREVEERSLELPLADAELPTMILIREVERRSLELPLADAYHDDIHCSLTNGECIPLMCICTYVSACQSERWSSIHHPRSNNQNTELTGITALIQSLVLWYACQICSEYKQQYMYLCLAIYHLWA